MDLVYCEGCRTEVIPIFQGKRDLKRVFCPIDERYANGTDWAQFRGDAERLAAQAATRDKRQAEHPFERHNVPEGSRSLIVAQFTECPLCRKRFTKERPRVLDHDHKTGRIRGVICGDCNRTLGFAKDSAVALRRMATYLDEDNPYQLHAW